MEIEHTESVNNYWEELKSSATATSTICQQKLTIQKTWSLYVNKGIGQLGQWKESEARRASETRQATEIAEKPTWLDVLRQKRHFHLSGFQKDDRLSSPHKTIARRGHCSILPIYYSLIFWLSGLFLYKNSRV